MIFSLFSVIHENNQQSLSNVLNAHNIFENVVKISIENVVKISITLSTD